MNEAHKDTIMNTKVELPSIEEILNNKTLQKRMKAPTPADVEEAVETDRRLLPRMKFNEKTGRCEYDPPLTRAELGDLLDAHYAMQFPIELPERTYTDPSNPKRKAWIKAVQKVHEYFQSDLHRRVVLDLLRSRTREVKTEEKQINTEAIPG